LSAWVVSSTWVQTFAHRMSEREIMAMPMGKTSYSRGKVYTYGELISDVDKVFTLWREAAVPYGGELEKVPLEKRQEIVRGMPMYGESMWHGKKGGDGCDYCAVRRDCLALHGGL